MKDIPYGSAIVVFCMLQTFTRPDIVYAKKISVHLTTINSQ